ncbi:ligand-binding sensor domain-containing protein [Hanstruepera ponticola]|uniref:hypothetical protein n=1 Tax=Hanstruepera ponticola TaxID=2042995 RepID=UPI0017874677|nr:hypothetical protein [Hanstruepera ponticola]
MRILLLFLVILETNLIFSQDSIPSIVFNNLDTNYKDFVVLENDVYAITKGDSLVAWNTQSNKVKLINSNSNSITKNSKNEIFAGLSDGRVIVTSSNQIITKVPEEEYIYFILIDNNNKLLIVTNKSFVLDGKIYQPNDKNSRFFWRSGYRKPSNSLIKPDTYFLDSKNRLWLGYDSGEWGGDMCFFNLNTKEFFCDDSLGSIYNDKYGDWPEDDSIIFSEFPEKVVITKTDTLIKFPHNLYTSNIKGITEDREGNFYTSESLMHFFVDGRIDVLKKTEFEDFYKNESLKYILENETSIKEYKNKDGDFISYTKMDIKEYLGPISYNPFDYSVYYYTNNGFFRIIKKDGSYDKELILNPTLTWKAGLPNAVGYQMSVKKFEFLDKNRFVFLTNLNGIGYFDGQKIKYYK